jgi:pimeloyl-ACP methyl ester carboxylesterase
VETTSQAYLIDRSVNVGSINLNYRRRESNPGNPPFLLIHGLASALRIWDLVTPPLVALTDAGVVAIDQRGHGRSDKPDNGYTTEQVVADDFALATALGLEKPIVVGHSWGATIALAYAATHPVSAVVLVDGGMGSMKERMTWEEAEKNLAPPDFAGTPKDMFLSFYRRAREAMPFEDEWSAQFEDLALNIVQLREDNTVAPRLSRANHMQILYSLWSADNFGLAKAVTVPTLMISAEPSTNSGDARSAEWATIKRAGAEKMLAALANSPKAEFVAMPDTIHDIPLQRPKALTELIVRFCTEAGII